MKKCILSGILSILVMSGLLLTVKSSASGNSESANGQGTLINQDGSQSQFTFNVRRNPNGRVTGQAVLRNPSFKPGTGQNEQIKIDVSCLKVVGNMAIFGGVTRRKNNQADFEAAYFAVGDNGNGAGADKIFRGFFFDDDASIIGDPQVCQSIEPAELPALEPIADGNIYVKK